jgi:ribA/ribD-fused uncharacterized protein
MNNEFEFFWNGPFSQWYSSKFVKDGLEFNCCEQYMMYRKAELFDDYEMRSKIMKTNNPKDQKAFGRLVKNFDEKLWNYVAQDIVYAGNYAKFSQNPRLLKALLETGDKILVEASPYDRIWGIGLSELDAKKTSPENWKGLNLLGIVLTKVRDDLKIIKPSVGNYFEI